METLTSEYMSLEEISRSLPDQCWNKIRLEPWDVFQSFYLLYLLNVISLFYVTLKKKINENNEGTRQLGRVISCNQLARKKEKIRVAGRSSSSVPAPSVPAAIPPPLPVSVPAPVSTSPPTVGAPASLPLHVQLVLQGDKVRKDSTCQPWLILEGKYCSSYA